MHLVSTIFYSKFVGIKATLNSLYNSQKLQYVVSLENFEILKMEIFLKNFHS